LKKVPKKATKSKKIASLNIFKEAIFGKKRGSFGIFLKKIVGMGTFFGKNRRFFIKYLFFCVLYIKN
jgi:hypothetical protein